MELDHCEMLITHLLYVSVDVKAAVVPVEKGEVDVYW
jgi:hypothetical protein